jgi:hypothetical protein
MSSEIICDAFIFSTLLPYYVIVCRHFFDAYRYASSGAYV